MGKKYKFIRLEKKTHAALDKVRQKDETYNEVIIKLIMLSKKFDNHKSVKKMIAIEADDVLFDAEQKARGIE